MRLAHTMRVYLPVITLIAWAVWTEVFGKPSLSTIIWLMAFAASLYVHIKEERSHGR